MMGEFLVLLLYIVFALILGILAFVLKKKRSQFPDFRVGYHNKKIMESKEKWEYANNVAGNLCALFAVIGVAIFIIFNFMKAILDVIIIVFFLYCAVAISTVLIAPVRLANKK